METIVVGVDGSEGSKRALRWALEHAAISGGARVVALMTWSYPVVPAAPFGAAYVPMEDLTESTEQALREVLDEVVGTSAPAGVEVSPVVRSGPAANVLLEEGRDADLVVVGSRGLGGFTGLLLGSVSHQVASHATCPVAVIPPPSD